MEKLSRTVLKGIVKECIVEILQESFLNVDSNISENKLRRKNPKRKPRSIKEYSTLEQDSQKTVRNESFDRKIDTITSSITKDPVFADIFKDTANTTLQSQLGAESKTAPVIGAGLRHGADSATLTANQSDPMELFSESSNKWAQLAFSDPIK